MPPGRRSRIPTPSKELIIPLALGLTAAIASVGLYLWPDTENTYSPGNSEDEREKKENRTLRTRRQFLEHDRITEEDTDDLEEDRRRDEELRLKGKKTRSSTVMSGALQFEKTVGSAVAGVAGKAKDVVAGVLPGGKRESEAVKELKREAAMNREQYVPPPLKKKSVAIVVSERKALEGHDSDEDFEETGLPTSLLSHLPNPLDLTLTTLNILISSPHLSKHPLSQLPGKTSSRVARKDSAVQQQSSYFSAPRRVPSVLSSNASTYTLAASVLPDTYPLEHILPFTHTDSVTPLLRMLAPEIVYIEEPLTNPSNGALVSGLLEGGWVGSVVVVLVGEDDQFAGLVDSDDEGSQEERKSKGEGRWWGDSSPGGIRAKFGGRVQVVEGWVLAEDWRRRIEERG